MPLLMCPNDNAQMQTLDRNGVQFDMCPTCRGVWLDRGELEKLMEGAPAAAAPQAYAPQSQPWGQTQQPYREQPRYRDDDDRHYKKKKRDSIFDIFD
ncbi:zf-TFIIB domain-containing protein [Brevundimonas subvibrioides]|uniref:TFIIB-type zinc ribbon-containing protein n=1 Tax=Brevundimonas subvibrioides TaxID=74313 RepID=UPI0022B5A6DE|nr:zf-TFIIB domain-containing protein [Brevundimonas subvibrioides]